MKQLLKKTLLIIICLSCYCNIKAQGKSYKKAEVEFELNQYFKAIELYKDALVDEKKADIKADILYKIGICYTQIKDYKNAIKFFSKAVKSKVLNKDAFIKLADCYANQQKYKEALVEYNNYLKLVPGDSVVVATIKKCTEAQNWTTLKSSAESRIVVTNAFDINTKESDASPAYVDKKYNKIIFSSNRLGSLGGVDEITGTGKYDLYETSFDKKGKWSAPVQMPEEIISDVNESSASITKKGDIMYFTSCPEVKGQKLKCQIYLSRKNGLAWSKPEKLNFNEDSVTFAHPSISADGKTLYFTSGLSGGQGGKDIWKSTYNGSEWGAPENLGASINTSGDEMFPYISDDNETLYFSSNKHFGLGGLDIFKAKKSANGQFETVPENMKYPINSGFDDFGIIFEGKKYKGYFTSNRTGSKGAEDIYMFYMPPIYFNLNGMVVSGQNSEPIKKAIIHLKGSNGDMFEKITEANGKYTFTLKENTSYEVSIATDKNTVSTNFPLGYLSSSDGVTITTVGEFDSKDFSKNFTLTPVLGEIRFPAVLYDLAASTLRPESKDSLNYLYQTLIDNPTIIIELQSHTDSQGDDKANQTLSEARAKSCVDYLVNEKKVSIERLQFKGFGEKKLLIKDEVINAAATKAEKDALHAKNRRTVFRILSWDYINPNAPKSTVPLYKPQVLGEEDSEDIE